MAQDLHLDKNLVESNLRTKGSARGFTSKILFEKANLFASSGNCDAFSVLFALHIFEVILFQNIEGFIDKTAVTIFISINLVPTLLTDAFFSFLWRNQKRDNVGALKWSQRLMSLDAEDVVWYCRDYDGVGLIYSCGDFHNVPFVSSRGGVINYNPILSLRQLGYQLKKEPEAKLLEELLIAEGVKDADMMKRIRRAWGKVYCIGKKELGKQNCIVVNSYTKWVRVRAKGIKLPYPWEPSTSFKAPKPFVVVIHEETILRRLSRA
ncbi:uncharacterized protein LOC127099511 [Lathyrus oleraceus]|uniref:uncharacterized protein LOC127099511 n=1 Tax=Pisum sativum TaxID=3888 RepID=UPI0021D247B1|nr:uncharacterized protein LOC127099511 [Pisum sativum]